MRQLFTTVFAMGLLSSSVLLLGQERKRVSPRETVEATLGGKKITIEYSRPYLKGRSLDTLAPAGKVWRTGADEATVLTTAGDLMIGSLHVPAGSYALFTIPGESEWTLILNKTAKQWGAFQYKDADDLGRMKMKVTANPSPVEQFTIAISGNGMKGELKMMWGGVSVSAPLMMH
jgi:hypothetical protein